VVRARSRLRQPARHSTPMGKGLPRYTTRASSKRNSTRRSYGNWRGPSCTARHPALLGNHDSEAFSTGYFAARRSPQERPRDWRMDARPTLGRGLSGWIAPTQALSDGQGPTACKCQRECQECQLGRPHDVFWLELRAKPDGEYAENAAENDPEDSDEQKSRPHPPSLAFVASAHLRHDRGGASASQSASVSSLTLSLC
jgi:hypothetical protein